MPNCVYTIGYTQNYHGLLCSLLYKHIYKCLFRVYVFRFVWEIRSTNFDRICSNQAPKVLKADWQMLLMLQHATVFWVTQSNLDYISIVGSDPKQLHLINCIFPADRALLTIDEINCAKYIIRKGLLSHDIQIKWTNFVQRQIHYDKLG